GDDFAVVVPSWRATKDVTIKADVVEEITRIYGYDNFTIETTLSALHPVRPLQVKADEAAIKDALVKQFGLHEVHTYIWCDRKKLTPLHIPLPENVSLLNGMNPDATVLRNAMQQTLLPVLNENRFFAPDFGVFECGRVVKGQKENGDCNERRTLGIAMLTHPLVPRAAFALFLDMITTTLENLRRKKVTFVRTAPTFAWQHPQNTASVWMDGKELGYVAATHPEVQDAIDKRGMILTAEIDLDTFAEIAGEEIRYEEPSKFPGIDIDLSFVVGQDGTFGEIEQAFKDNPNETLKKISLVDVYEAEGTKSITIRLHFVSPVKTLSKPEVQSYIDEVLSALAKNNIVLRG
ncbi:MAG: phenylalanine--tRNA ligase subunit beta, partial [Clostridia bacterium]|nr:phenylalanine--tRNA ligase subunit beta [Clostridia bacterium]